MKVVSLNPALYFLVLMLASYSNVSLGSSVEDLELEELMHINVSVGSLFDENELEVGNTIDVVTKEDWHRSGAKDLNHAIGHLPSVFPLENIWGSALSIRGFTNNLSIRGVSFLVDGISLNNLSNKSAFYDQPMYDLGGIDKIEVLRGPGSAVHGSDAFHGVLSLATFERDEDYMAAETEAASNDWQHISYQQSQGIANWRVNASFSQTDQGDRDIPYEYTDPFDGIEKASSRNFGQRTKTAVVKVAGPWSDHLRTSFAGYYSEWYLDEGVGFLRGAAESRGFSIARDRDVTGNDASFSMAKWRLDSSAIEGVDASLDLYYWQQSSQRSFDGSAFNDLFYVGDKKENTSGLNLTFQQNADRNPFNTQWLVRYAFERSEIEKDQLDMVNLVNGVELTEVKDTQGYSRHIDSLVIQAKTGFYANRVYALFGTRVDEYRDVGSKISPKAGIIFHPSRRSSIKLTYGQAFRAPTPSELLGSSLIDTSPGIKPETIDTYEASYLLHTTRNRFLVTLFNSFWKDGLVVESNVYRNYAENESRGIEISLNGVWHSFTYKLNGAYVESENIDSDSEYGAFPSTMFNVELGYQWPAYDVAVFWNNRVLLDMAEGPITEIHADPEALPSYYRSDVHVSWKPTARLTTWLNVRNLFDRENALPSILNVENGYLEESRNLSLGFKYSFN